MDIYAKAVKARLTTKEYEELVALAQAKDVTVAELVREVIVAYLEDVAQERRLSTVERLVALDAPVADWTEMEAEIERGVLDAD